jgi:hypothetical protein
MVVMLPARPPRDRDRLEKQLVQLQSMLKKGRANLVLLDPENLPAAQERIRHLDEERAAVERELRQCEPPSERDVNAVALEVMNNLWQLAYCCRSLTKPSVYYEDAKGVRRRGVDNGDGRMTAGSLESAALRAVRRFLSHVSHIACHTTRRGRGNSTRHVFSGGEIAFDRVGPDSGKVNPHVTG